MVFGSSWTFTRYRIYRYDSKHLSKLSEMLLKLKLKEVLKQKGAVHLVKSFAYSLINNICLLSSGELSSNTDKYSNQLDYIELVWQKSVLYWSDKCVLVGS